MKSNRNLSLVRMDRNLTLEVLSSLNFLDKINDDIEVTNLVVCRNPRIPKNFRTETDDLPMTTNSQTK